MQERITEAQLRTIYGDTIDALYGYASRKCGGERELAEDVTQEVWLRAVRAWQRTGVPDSPQAWLITVARNLIINHLRRRPSVSIDAVSPSAVLAAVEDDTVGDSEEITARVNRALTRIPKAEATLLEAFHFERRTMAQLARTLGISERAVEGRLRRARERLRSVMSTTTPG